MKEYIKCIREKIGHDLLIMAGAGVLLHDGKRILLQKRRDNGKWSLHGGCIEVGEKPEDTAARELFEETGLAAQKLELYGVFAGENTFYTYPNGDQVYVISCIYTCCDFTGEMTSQTEETTDLQWFEANEITQELINPCDREPILKFAAYLAGKN